MITLVTTAKPFQGHSGIIQKNALKSWTLLHPDAEIILFGDDPGAADIARELGLRHEPYVERNEHGTKRLDYMFRRAQEIARHDLLCYINCDILLTQDFRDAVQRVATVHPRFLMIGKRWDTDITEPLNFTDAAWARHLQTLARGKGVQQLGHTIDYFVFRRTAYSDMPPLVVGRIWWDHWLVWKARQDGLAVVDVSDVVKVVHQNHDYGYHPAGAKGVWEDVQARSNYELAGGRWHLYTIDDATYRLRPHDERRKLFYFWAPYWRYLRPKCIPLWFGFLHVTRPLRKMLGMRRAAYNVNPANAEQENRG